MISNYHLVMSVHRINIRFEITNLMAQKKWISFLLFNLAMIEFFRLYLQMFSSILPLGLIIEIFFDSVGSLMSLMICSVERIILSGECLYQRDISRIRRPASGNYQEDYRKIIESLRGKDLNQQL